jgi:hypothetical protein
MEPEDPRLVAAARHALHDEELVAAFAVDGDASEEAGRARTLIERCQICADLHADLVAVGSAIRAAGSAEAVGALRPAPRDFRLTASDAVRLRGGNVFQRAAARLLDGVATFGRPVGATFAALGVVGLLVGTMALAPLGSPASMSGGAAGPPAPGATSGTAAGYEPEATSGFERNNGGPTGSAEEDVTTKLAAEDDGALSSPIPWVFAGSLVLLVLGVALLRSGARQRRMGPRRANRT